MTPHEQALISAEIYSKALSHPHSSKAVKEMAYQRLAEACAELLKYSRPPRKGDFIIWRKQRYKVLKVWKHTILFTNPRHGEVKAKTWVPIADGGFWEATIEP